MKKVFFLVIIAAVGGSQAGSGLAALQIGSSSRATAMAEAAVAVDHGAGAPFWNPAALAWLNHRQAHFTHNEWYQGINHEALSLTLPGQNWSWGVHTLLTSVDGIEQRNTATEEPLSTFSAHTVAFGLTVARRLGEQLSVGLNVRYLYEKIYVESASGYTVDIGLQYHTTLDGLTVAAAVQNLGMTTALDEEKINLPETIRIGASYRLPLGDSPLQTLLAADYVTVLDKDSYLNAGVEIRPLSLLALRAGYAANHSNRDFSMGFGLFLKSWLLDYAYVPFKQGLGNTHQFSITVDL
jgi:long-subunit fatty acid transport protein